jgi:TolB protein
MKAFSRIPLCSALALVFLFAPRLPAQDWVHTGTNLGNERIRLAAADFKPVGADPQTPELKAAFDATLQSDLANAGIFDLVSKSLAPQVAPGSPQEINLEQWSAAPANAAMVAFGALSVADGRLAVYGWLDDARNTANPQVLGKQYSEQASQDMARTIAHRFADEIILRLGGGVNGIAETKIFFVSSRSGAKEIWEMDYDGQNQHQVTHLGSISLSPRISPDSTRLAFASLGRDGWAIRMYSLELNRMVSFSAGTAGGSNQSPAWSGDGAKLAFSSSRSGDSQIWVSEVSGGNPHSVTALQRADRVGGRAHRPAADLHHGSGRRQCAAAHRRRLCRIALVVAQRTAAHLQLESQVRPRRARRPGHLRDGHRQQALAATHPRRRQQRLSILVARRTPHCFSAGDRQTH